MSGKDRTVDSSSRQALARPSVSDWISASRPRTLPAGIVPVAVGVAIARSSGRVVIWHAVLALFVSLAVQIGTNYANDYADGKRGTDAVRVGPMRLVASGKASAATVRRAALLSFGLAAVAGLVLCLATSPYLLVLGAACIAAGWLYTGGPRPYGYFGLGEAFVFVFFGPVAVLGTVYVSCAHLPGFAWLDAVPVGLLAVSLLVVNNLRDIPTDATSGKRTLAVVMGDRPTRALYGSLLVLTYLCVIAAGFSRHFALFALASAPLAIAPTKTVRSGATGRDLIPVLGKTGGLQLLFGALFAIGIAL